MIADRSSPSRVRCAASRPGRLRADPGDVAVYEGGSSGFLVGEWGSVVVLQDRELYRQILGIESPWKVARVELRRADGEVFQHLQSPLAVPPMQRRVRTTTIQPDRSVPHDPARPAAAQRLLRRVATAPRLPAPPRCLKLSRSAGSQPARHRRELGRDGILERAVQRGLERRAAEPIPYLGVDEKSFRKRHRYLTVVNDLNPLARVVRRRGTPPGQPGRLLEDVERRATRPSRGRRDVWDPYVASTREHLDESEKKILRQISHRGAGEGGGPSAAGGEQAFTGPRRRAFDRHEVRLGGIRRTFPRTPGASSARCAKAT